MLTDIIVIERTGKKSNFDAQKMVDAIINASKDSQNPLDKSHQRELETRILSKLDGHQIFTPDGLNHLATNIIQDMGRTDILEAYLTKYQKYHTVPISEMKVVKKSGLVEPFDFNKIFEAISKSAHQIGHTITDSQFDFIKREITRLSQNYTDILSSENVHQMVMESLYTILPDVHKIYLNYHNARKEQARLFHDMLDESETIKYGSFNENANKDSQVITTKSALITEIAMKKFMRTTLNPEWIQAHDEGWIYIHDLADLYKDTFNCDLFDLETLMTNKEHEDGVYAFKINNKVTHQPKHVSSAFDIMSSVTIAASGNQFGGFTINAVDKILAPYAELSYQYYLQEALDYDIPNGEKYATDKTLKEIRQGVQSYTYELAQTQNALGQTPFTTISFGMDTSKWGREITKAILLDRMQPENKDVFPKLVFMYRKEINGNPDSPNYDLFQLSLECSSKKLYPDYLSFDYEGDGEHYRRDVYERSGKTIAPMGCRAHLSPFIDPDSGQDVVNGRFNIGAVSLNPVKIALESIVDGQFNQTIFNEHVEHYANMIFDILNWRYERVGQLKGASNPLFWTEGGAWKRIGMNQRVNESNLLDGATASIGYCGLYEMVNAMYGENWKHVPNEVRKQHQIDFLEHINAIRESRKERDNHPYALYSTPAESLVFTWEKLLTKQYGIIEGVTDRDYLTNSFHVPVWEHISAIEKIDYEKDFHTIAKGGHISYAEFNYGVSSSSLEAIVKYAMRNGLYFGVNVISATCEKCGHQGDFLMACDSCGSEDIVVIQRICGYLSPAKRSGVIGINSGKWSEIQERVKHGIQRGQLGTQSYREKHSRE